MMRFVLSLMVVLLVTACAPSAPPLHLPEDCRAEFTALRLTDGHWLLQGGTWRLRQAALLQMGPKKIPMEGFLRLDLKSQAARLLAMNDMGLVLFDLEVTLDKETLHRAVPQLQKREGVAQGIARSLRHIFFQPHPQADCVLENRDASQVLTRPLADGSLTFTFDCRGDLRETRQETQNDDWRVVYNRYKMFDGSRLPEEIVMNDFQHRVKLSLWLREVRQEP